MVRKEILLLLMYLCSIPLLAQSKEESDSLIRLLNAKKIQLLEVNGQAYRKVEGPARFLHNNTYLICDTALWNVDSEYIDAIGHVQIVQDNTLLTGDKLHYDIPTDMAQFRGSLVELKDNKGNALRTEFLDYNTKDSIAYFHHGASMRDSTGNIIESVEGTYESKINLFTFIKKVQMFSDSLFFVSDVIKYRTDIEVAYFSDNTKGWKNQNYFSSDGGWYNRSNETLLFDNGVYGQTKDYELWCDEFFFDRITNHAILRRDVQVRDTVDGAFILGDKLEFLDQPRSVMVTQNPVFVGLMETETDGIDTVFVAADTLHYYSMRMFEVDSITKIKAEERKANALVDVVANVREAAKAKAKKEKEDKEKENKGKMGLGPALEGPHRENPIVADSLSVTDTLVVRDSLQVADSLLISDSLQVADSLLIRDSLKVSDSLEVVPLDTTEINFLEAYHSVKVYTTDNQVKCDSLLYSDLDSIVRMFKDPVIWNEVTNQLTADSMQMVMQNGTMKKGLMFSNAFLASHDSESYYNQIKAPEMAGFFEDGEIVRFDAMGGSAMLIYMKDSTTVAYANVKDCKIISSLMEDGELKKNYYFESIKSNLFPIEDLGEEDRVLKGFNWRGGERPVDRFALTDVILKKSIRKYTLESPYYPLFDYTSKYFPGYMEGIMEEIRIREPWIWKSSKRKSYEGL